MFTLGEYLCEESNCLYKMIRLFSYDVPTGEDKRALMALGRYSIDYLNRVHNFRTNITSLKLIAWENSSLIC